MFGMNVHLTAFGLQLLDCGILKPTSSKLITSVSARLTSFSVEQEIFTEPD